MKHRHGLAWLVALGSSLTWSMGVAMLNPLFADGLNHEMVAGFRSLFGGLVLALAAYVYHLREKKKHLAEKADAEKPPWRWGQILAIGAFYAASSYTFVKSIGTASSTGALTIMVGGSPIFIALLQWIFKGIGLKRWEKIGVVVLVLVIPLVLKHEWETSSTIGLVWAALCPLFWGGAVLLTDEKISLAQKNAAYSIGCIMLVLAMYGSIAANISSVNGFHWLLLFGAGALSQAGSMVLFVWALQNAESPIMPLVVLGLNLPLAVGIVVAFGQEMPPLLSIIGCAIVVLNFAYSAYAVWRQTRIYVR